MTDNGTDRHNGDGSTRILYCRCAYADVVPHETKDEVLRRLCDDGRPFDTVADLCEMSARRDPALHRIADSQTTIVACYPRAVRNLFRAADAPLGEGTGILNMRTQSAQQIAEVLIEGKPIESITPADDGPDGQAARQQDEQPPRESGS